MHVRRRIHRPASPGFTLIELMMVVVIIALLVATIIPLIGDLVTQSRRAATRTTITKLQEILQKRLDAFEGGFPELVRSPSGKGRDYEPANPGDVMFRKERFRWFFWEQAGLGPNQGASEAKSAAVLYLLVTEGVFFGTAAEDAGQFNAAEIGEVDINGTKHKVFVDSWGNPLAYYPYPTRLFKPDGHVVCPAPVPANNGVNRNGGATYLFRSLVPDSNLNEDQDDPFGVLSIPIVRDATGNIDCAATKQKLAQWEQNYHSFSTYHTPLILSAGPDGQFGLYDRTDAVNSGHLARPKSIEPMYDNISNHNIKAGDK